MTDTNIYRDIAARTDGAFMLAILGIGIVAISAVLSIISGLDRKPASGSENTHTLIIDPGHGGIDGGAISPDGKKRVTLTYLLL